jgi:hypothetical protein
MKYRSTIEIEALIKAANKELRATVPEGYKVFLLAVAVGLRRKAIDLLKWSSFRWEENAIRIQPTRYFHPKSKDSIADLPVDAEVMDIFRKNCESQEGSLFSGRDSLNLRNARLFRGSLLINRNGDRHPRGEDCVLRNVN